MRINAKKPKDDKVKPDKDNTDDTVTPVEPTEPTVDPTAPVDEPAEPEAPQPSNEMLSLMSAVDKARDAGLTVTVAATEVTEDGVSINRSNR